LDQDIFWVVEVGVAQQVGAIAISSGAVSTSSVTAISRNRCGQIDLPNASFVRCTI
jgi:hypothetical protein